MSRAMKRERPSGEATARWLVIRTRTGRELDVCDALRERVWVPRADADGGHVPGHWRLGAFTVPVCCMVEASLRHRNGYDKHKGEARTTYARPVLRGYVFAALDTPQDPVLAALRDRGLVLGVMGRMDPDAGDLRPVRLTDAAVGLFRDMHASDAVMDYDRFIRLAESSAGDDPLIRRRARMATGLEFDVGDAVSLQRGAAPPMRVIAFTAHDTCARVLYRLFGKDVVQDVPIEKLRRAS